MKTKILTTAAALFTLSAFSQVTISDLMVEETDNVLRMDVSFSTDEQARSYIEYSRVITDSLGNALDTTTQYTPLSDPASDHYFNVWELVAETEYNCTVWALNANGCDSEDFSFTTGLLPEVVPTLDSLYVNEDADLEGYFLTNALQTDDRTMQIYNRRGETVWYTYHSGEPEQGLLGNCQMFSVTDDNRILTLECHQMNEWDLRGNLLSSADLNGTEWDSLFFHHDVIINEAGNFVGVAADTLLVDFGDSTQYVINENLLEVTPLGEVVWTWSAADHFDITTAQHSNGFFTPMFGSAAINWLHCNTVSQDEDGNYMMSFKEQHELVKVDAVTGEVIWVLGGNNPTIDFQPFDSFGDQHAIYRTFVGTYMIFDNTGLDTLSRFFEFSLEVYDELTAVPQWEFVLPQDKFSNILGNARRRPGGIRYGCSGNKGSVFEVDQFGEVLWHLRQSNWTYRTYWIDQLEEVSIDDITMGDNPDLVCIDEPLIGLNAEPAGGCWSGIGVVNGEFDPMAAGLGTHTLTYRWGWNEMSIDVEVSDAVPPCAVNITNPTHEANLNLFPNPNNGTFNLKLRASDEAQATVQIVDLLGKVVWSNQMSLVLGENTLSLELDLAPGNYILQVKNGSEISQTNLQIRPNH